MRAKNAETLSPGDVSTTYGLVVGVYHDPADKYFIDIEFLTHEGRVHKRWFHRGQHVAMLATGRGRER